MNRCHQPSKIGLIEVACKLDIVQVGGDLTQVGLPYFTNSRWNILRFWMTPVKGHCWINARKFFARRRASLLFEVEKFN